MATDNLILSHPKVGVYNIPLMVHHASLPSLSVCVQFQQMQDYGVGTPSQMYAAMYTYLDLTEGTYRAYS